MLQEYRFLWSYRAIQQAYWHDCRLARKTEALQSPLSRFEVMKPLYTIMENRMGKKVENDMETREYIGVMLGLYWGYHLHGHRHDQQHPDPPSTTSLKLDKSYTPA